MKMQREILAVVLAAGMLHGCLGGGGSDQTSQDSGGYCDVCPTDTRITLSWDPNPESDGVIGYLVYYGASRDSTIQLVSDLSIANPDFDASAPQIRYEPFVDLGAEAGAMLCFRLKAYNNTAVSEFSEVACTEV